MAVTAGTALLRIVPDLTGLAAKIQGGIGAPLRQVGEGFNRAGRTLTAGLTLPIVGLGYAAVKTAMDWESAFAGVEKTLEATPEELRAIEQGLRDMSKQIPTSAEDLAGIAEAAGAMGIAKEDVLGFTRVVADMAETTDLTTESAATAFGQLGNVLKLSGEDFDRLGATIVDLGNKGASTESEITELMLRLAGTGATVGLSASQIAGLAASMANAGINAEAGGTAMSRVLQKINEQVANSGPKLAGFAKVANMSADEFSRAFKERPAEAVTAFLEGLRRMEAGGANVIGTLDKLGISEARQIDTLTRLANSKMTVAKTLGIANNAWRDNNALTNEAEKRYKTTAARFDIFKNTAKDALVTLGAALLPVFQNVINGLKPVIGVVARLFEWFGKLPTGVQTFVVVLAGLVAALGPVLMMIGAVASGISAVVPVLGVLGAAFGAIVGVITSPITLIVAAVVGLAYVIYRNWDTIKRWTAAAWNAVKNVLATVWGWIRTAVVAYFNLYRAVVVGVWNAVRSATSAVWGAIRAVLSTVWGWIKTAVSAYFNAYRAVIVAVWNAIRAVTSAVWNAIRGVLSSVWSAIRGIVSGGINAIRSILVGGWNAIRGAAQAAWNAVVSIFTNAWNRISGIVSKISGALSKLAFWRKSPSALEVNARESVRGVLAAFNELDKKFPTLRTAVDMRVPARARVSPGISDADAARIAAAAGDGPGNGPRIGDVNVTAETNADAAEIGREIVWQVKTKLLTHARG
jgi:TP901 family phage tail tape measure protein